MVDVEALQPGRDPRGDSRVEGPPVASAPSSESPLPADTPLGLPRRGSPSAVNADGSGGSAPAAGRVVEAGTAAPSQPKGAVEAAAVGAHNLADAQVRAPVRADEITIDIRAHDSDGDTSDSGSSIRKSSSGSLPPESNEVAPGGTAVARGPSDESTLGTLGDGERERGDSSAWLRSVPRLSRLSGGTKSDLGVGARRHSTPPWLRASQRGSGGKGAALGDDGSSRRGSHFLAPPVLLRTASNSSAAFERWTSAARQAPALVLAELQNGEWHPGRLLRSLLVFIQLAVILYYASELYEVYEVAQANPATSLDTRTDATLPFPHVVVCNSFAPGVRLEPLTCSLTGEAGGSTNCMGSWESFVLLPAGAREAADAAAADAAAAAAAARQAAPSLEPALEKSVDAAVGDGGAAARANSSDGSGVEPLPADVRVGAAAGAAAAAAEHPAAGAPAAPAAPAAAGALPADSVQCIRYASSAGPSHRYEHLDLSVRVHSEQFPPPPTMRAVNVWLLGERALEAFKRAAPAELPLPDMHAVEVRYLTRVLLSKVESVLLEQSSALSLPNFFKHYRRYVGLDDRRLHEAERSSVDASGNTVLDEYSLATAVAPVQGAFASLDCVFLELRWKSTTVTVKKQYRTFTFAQFMAGVFATTTFTNLARALIVYCVAQCVYFGRRVNKWRRRRRRVANAAAGAPAAAGADAESGRALTLRVPDNGAMLDDICAANGGPAGRRHPVLRAGYLRLE